jgi:uncharacterized protein YbgA (DUF1722 family)
LLKAVPLKDLNHFHTRHKLLILFHSPKHLSALGRLVGNIKRSNPEELLSQYIKLLMEGLQLLATVNKNTNVLQHIMGYFRKNIDPGDKQELIDVIENYHGGYLPLIAPMVLIKHYIRKFDEPYLKKQLYLDPHPTELMLRNHV